MPTLTLTVQATALPPTWKGKPQEFLQAIAERLTVVFPEGRSTFVVSDTQPTSNQGPWLKNGTQWWVYDEDEKTYIPLDIEPSETVPYIISETAPSFDSGDTVVPIWIRIRGERGVGIYVWHGDEAGWSPLGAQRGNTAGRPSDPIDGEKYFDTTIETEIYWSASAGEWKTVSGSKGDIKYVKWPTLTQALQYNPGWQEIGQNLADDDIRGRAMVPAHIDQGGSPETDLAAGTGITKRKVRAEFGAETHEIDISEMPEHSHPVIQYSAVQSAGGGGTLQTGTYNVLQRIQGTARYLEMTGHSFGTYATGDEGAVGNAGDGDAINITAPRVAFWCLVKK